MASSSYFSTALVIHEIDEPRRKFLPRSLLTVANLICTAVLVFNKHENKIFPKFSPDAMPRSNKTSTGLVLPAACFFEYPGAITLDGSLANFTGSDQWTQNSSHPQKNYTGSAPSNVTLQNYFKFSSTDVLFTHSDDIFIAVVVTTILFFGSELIELCCTANAAGRERRLRGYSPGSKKAMDVVRTFFWISSLVQLSIGTVRFVKLQRWMIRSNWFGKGDERGLEGSIGQFMPLVMLILPVLGFLGALLGT